MGDDVIIIDDALQDPQSYRSAALVSAFHSVAVGPAVFHGIALDVPDIALPRGIVERFPHLTPTMSFFRQSPAGQAEPNYIHTDLDMGEWTGILYLTPDPPSGDGTAFWRHLATGAVGSVAATDAARLDEWMDWRQTEKWERWQTVEAVFNRLLLFPARLFHSRAIAENYGDGDGARLIQIVFGTGALHQEIVCR